LKPALRQIAFLLSGGNRLNGWCDEPEARGFHLLLAVFLMWDAAEEFLVIPLFTARRAATASLALLAGAAAMAALALLRRGHRRAAAALFLGVVWCAAACFSVFGGSIRNPGTGLAIVLILAAGWLLGRPAALGLAGATIALLACEASLEYAGYHLPHYFSGPPFSLLGFDVGMVLMVVFPVLGFLESQRRRLAALGDSEERFRGLSNAAYEGIMVHDACIILDVNLAFARMHGYDRPEELTGRNGLELMATPDSRERILQRLERGEVGPVEMTAVRKDGTTFPVELESSPVKFQGRDARRVACRDITERKRAEAELRARDDNYRRLIEQANDGIVLMGADGYFQLANPALCRMLGYSPEEMRLLHVLDSYPPAERETGERRFASARAGANQTFERAMLRKDGSTVAVEVSVRQLEDGRHQSIIRDITERKRAEALLRAREDEFRGLIEQANDGIFLLHQDGRFLVVNPAFCRMTGYTREELLQLSVLDTYVPGDRAAGALRRADIQNGLNQAFERALLRKDGSALEVEVSARQLDDGRHQSIVRDITERKRAEAALRAKEEDYRQVIEEAADGVFLLETDGRFVVVNPAICKMTGYTREEMLQMTVLDTYLPGERAAAERRQVDIRSAANVNFERLMRRKDGTALVVEVSARRLEDGRNQAIVRDITERKRAEDALRESERKTRALLDLSFGFIGMLSLDGTLLDANRTALQFAGIGRREALGKPFWETAWWNHSPELQERLRAAVGAAAGGKTVRFEAPLRAADGSLHPVDFSLKPVRDDGGQVVMLIPEGRDIADLKRAGEEKANLQAQLHQAQKMESIGRLAGGVAHDFNNLLTVINGYSRFLLDTLEAGDPARESLEEINRAGERAAGLTQQLLAFSRKQVLQPRVLDLNRVVRETRPMLARLVGEDVEVCVELHAEAAMVCADPHQIEQVIVNLAVNARDAMPGGGKLSIGTSIGEWSGRVAQAHPGARACRYVTLTVTDTGIGMDEETRRRIFEPFFTTKEVGKGTGLGLSMIQGVVEQSGGLIDVASEPGRGATFTVYLPWVAEAAVCTEAPEAIPGPAAGNQKTILVVEDQREVREFVAATLTVYGYRVIQAESAAEALPLWEREGAAIDLVLTDVVMPRLSGGELANLLWTSRPGTKVLFMSGYKDDVMAHDRELDASVEFIQKPFSPGQLAKRVGEMLKAADRPARILVADDEAGVRSYLRGVLEEAGYQVLEAADGDQALKEARAGHVDLVITDLVMPGREGLETIRALRKEAAGVGIIAISGALGPEFLEIARVLGAQAVLPKPLDAGQLLAKVAEVLKSRR
jgi:PAS domain S-box-containing protein